MRRCTSCQEELPLSGFSHQKRNPKELYRWCNDCRLSAVPNIPKMKATKVDDIVVTDSMAMLAKAREKRKLSPEQVAQVRNLKNGGLPYHKIAEQFTVSVSTIQKVMTRGYR